MAIKYGSRGKDVKKYKDILFKLGYLHASTHDRFLNDSVVAAKAFQRKNKDKSGKSLKVDGIIGPKTKWALDKAYAVYKKTNTPTPPPNIVESILQSSAYPKIDESIIHAISFDLFDEDDIRIAIVKEALRWVFPYGLYVYGANLYKTDLMPQLPTDAYIDTRARANPEYFTGGRKEWMKKQYAEAVKADRRIACADCSGFAVGILRLKKLVATGFDATAHNIYHKHCKAIKKADLRPGDFVFTRNASGTIPHMGIYLGAGYVIEAAGGAYGIQISKLDNHTVIDQMTKKTVKKAAWVLYGRPKYY